MKFWIVFWTVTSLIQVPCPDMEKEREESRKYRLSEQEFNTSCLVVHLEQKTVKHRKQFSTLKVAHEFVAGMPKNRGISEVFVSTRVGELLK